jgi:hypothetical protein
MEKTKAIFKNVWPYQKDKMNLPVADVGNTQPSCVGSPPFSAKPI